ncbi:MAG: UvrD-helicase domain-containing protein [Gaiellaceae bacterium MAG52_C11]|nr:UvrD-helicase domain-containing protein [Candidatus Gaiellasilicea maunaloa]
MRTNEQQRAAIAARGQVFVSAGAGTGKTTVLVERFVEAVCERGLDVESLLVITYTERAAGELLGRIRARLNELGRPDLARSLDGAWISTIHGFCMRLLKAHPFAAGLDPRFRILDESQGRVVRGEAFEAALGAFCSSERPERLQLLATYGASGLRRMLTSVYETLRSAGRELELELGRRPGLDARLVELAEAARCLGEDAGATELARAAATQAVSLTAAPQPPERLLDLSGLRAQGERAASYEEARKAVEQAALDELALRDRVLLQELLRGFAEAYAEAKDRESALDFEDLQLRARELLTERPDLREREQLRFRSIMVDEFQDTNRLQCELVDQLTGPGTEVFFVGDEFQSIYGFRHADVQVFRERRAAAETLLPLTRNYRSRPEVLRVVNHLFAAEFGDEFQELAASGEFVDPVFGTPVELLVTDKSAYEDTGLHWRRAEAKHVAQRVQEVVASGAASAGEIVLLFAAGTDAEWYEEELRAAGLPTYRATGRGYFGQQQVVDLLSYLRLLHNRYDDEALVTVLASPFVGVSNDALLLVRRAAGRRPIFTGIERTVPQGLTDRDERLLRAFRQRFDRLAEASARLSLERLCERIVGDHDYDLAVLAQWDGRRRYANLRKLARLARSYEELRGPDVEGFVRFVSEQEAVGAGERDAAAEEEGADAVRLLTIHSAKGLEFKVVVVADAGRDRNAPGADEILCLADGRFGFRVADPTTGIRYAAFGYDDVREVRKAEEEAERLRLYYVAMTRAIDRLIVSGSIDPRRKADERTPIGWVLNRLECAEEAAAATGPVELEREGARVLLRVDRGAVAEPAPAPAEESFADETGQLALFSPENAPPLPPLAPALAPILPLPMPPLHDVKRLSYSALALFERCSYRYYAERVVGMRPADASGALPGSTGLAATEIGDAVHRLLELVELPTPGLPDIERVRAWYPGVTDEELERIVGFVAAYCESELAGRIAGLSGAQPERPFAFEHDGVLLHGRLDVLQREGLRALVLDYKTNSLAEGSPEEIVEADYRLQRLVYALACFRAGAEEVEVVYHFLERPDAVVSRTFGREELPELEVELSEAIARIRAGEFVPSPSEFVCADCPALDVVCAGPRLRSAPRRPVALAAATS